MTSNATMTLSCPTITATKKGCHSSPGGAEQALHPRYQKRTPGEQWTLSTEQWLLTEHLAIALHCIDLGVIALVPINKSMIDDWNCLEWSWTLALSAWYRKTSAKVEKFTGNCTLAIWEGLKFWWHGLMGDEMLFAQSLFTGRQGVWLEEAGILEYKLSHKSAWSARVSTSVISSMVETAWWIIRPVQIYHLPKVLVLYECSD